MKGNILLAVAAILLTAAGPGRTFAQALEHERGNILSIDFDASKVELRDAKGRTFTRSFARDATVKFTDGARFFANPSVHDLRAPMYVHYMFQDDVIQHFDVVELGFDPAAAQAQKGQGQPRTVVGRVTAYDAAVRQVEIQIEDASTGASKGREGAPKAARKGTPETFQLTERAKASVKVGDRVELRTEWSGARELVVELRVLPDDGRRGRKPR